MHPSGELQFATSGLASTVNIVLPIRDTDELAVSKHLLKRNLAIHLAQMGELQREQCPVQ